MADRNNKYGRAPITQIQSDFTEKNKMTIKP